jgi:hypothetical protein
MYAGSTEEYRRKMIDGAPSFLVVRGIVFFSLGGFEGRLLVGEERRWRKHGMFRVEYAEDSYAIIHHELPWGRVVKVFIPSKFRCYISGGGWVLTEVNYQSFLESATHR